MKINIFKIFLLGLCSLFITPTASAETIGRFQIKQGIVTDSATGLTWMRCPLGMKWEGKTCKGKATSYKWEQALQAASGFSYAGYNDWRLPTIAELKTLVDKSAGNERKGIPYINSVVFPRSICTSKAGVACYIWSSTPSTESRNYAWIVYFHNGNDYYDSNNSDSAVRLVRMEK